MNIEFDNISTRAAFGEALLEAAERDETIMCIAADTLSSVGGGPLSEKYPDRALNVGIAEQDMALMGAGMAACGAKVFLATYSAYASMRICEQVRTFICYPNLDVKIVGGLSGTSGGQEGVSHQGLEDVGILRNIPNLVIVEPADVISTKVITHVIADYKGPVYMRIMRNQSPKVFNDGYEFEIGKANPISDDGNDAALFVTGAAVARGIQAQAILREKGYKIKLIEMPCIKPIDKNTIISAARDTKLVFTAEDHNVIGGLGSAVAEVLCEEIPTKLCRMGINDCFTESAEHEELMNVYGLNPIEMAQKIINGINNKNN